MPRKKRTSGQGQSQGQSLPLSPGEIWEVAQCPLDITDGMQGQPSEQPTVILAVEAGEETHVVQVHLMDGQGAPGVFAEFVSRAMHAPLQGTPRRPAIIRVASPAEAELLAVAPDIAGVVLEVAGELPTVRAVQTRMEMQITGLHSDYRTQAARMGEPLSPEALRAFFQRARQFYRQAMWEGYGDDTIFTVTMQPATGAARTLYGIIMGELGQELGLVLYPDLETLYRFYMTSLEHAEHWNADDGEDAEAQQAEAMSHLLQNPSVALTYTPQRDVAPRLIAEAKALKLPTANKTAFPLVMRTGDGGLRTATARELADMYVALGALLDWDQRIDALAADDATTVTLTSQVAAIADFIPDLTVLTALQDNPYLPADDEDDEEDGAGEESWLTAPQGLAEMLESLLESAELAEAQQPPSGRKGATSRKPPAPFTKPVYTLDVYLAAGPISEAYVNQEISRRIEILGSQTLHDLHQAIFAAFERSEQQPYVFNLGAGPTDRAHLYTSRDSNKQARHPQQTTLDTLQLEVGRQFGYTFDDEAWEHLVEVLAVAEARGKKPYPRVTHKSGQAPPQYDLGEPH